MVEANTGVAVQASGYDTLVQLWGAKVLDNTGEGVCARSNGEIRFGNASTFPATTVEGNRGGLDAGTGGLLDAGQCGGSLAPSITASATSAVPGALLSVDEARPNPASSEATVPLTLAEAADVEAVLYDALGRRVAVLASGRYDAGRHALALDGSALPAGVYVVHVVARGASGTAAAVRRITLAR